jgi:hypothetical protein
MPFNPEGTSLRAKARILLVLNGTAEECAEKVDIRRSAPKGAFVFELVAVSLKRYPDTKLEFFRSLLKPACLLALGGTAKAVPFPRTINENQTSSRLFRYHRIRAERSTRSIRRSLFH